MKKLLLLLLLITGLSNAQSVDKNVIILKNWLIANGKDFATKTNFTTSENGQTKSYFLSFNNQTVELRDAATKQVVEKYQNSIPTRTINVSCKVQEANQWATFKSGAYLKILAEVNKNCKAQRHCLTIFCNGVPTSSYLLLIKPTNCPVKDVTYNIPD